MDTIGKDDGGVYVTEVKVYDVRIAHRQAPTSDIVEWDVVIYDEIGGAWAHRLEEQEGRSKWNVWFFIGVPIGSNMDGVDEISK